MNNKKIMTGILAASMTMVMAIGGIFAFMNLTTNSVTNTFKGHGALTGVLTEPAWEKEGKELAESYRPNQIIPKDPRVQNTSDIAEWMAIKVSNLTEAKKTIVSPFINAGWELIYTSEDKDTEVYMYTEAVAAGNYAGQITGKVTGVPLFDSIQIQNIQAASALPEFDLDIVGYAIQGDATKAEATKELTDLAK